MSEVRGTSDSSFGSFMFGLTLGVIGALLLGTEEGRKTARKLLNSLSEGLEKNEDLLQEAKNVAGQAIRSYLPDESPPPSPPLTNRPARTPTYFTSGGESLLP